MKNGLRSIAAPRSARLLAFRVARLAAVLLIVTLGTSLLIDLVPGDPAVAIAGETASDAVIAAVREQYGFDQPILQRWWEWTASVVTGDLGESYSTRRPVTTLIAERLPVTIELTVLAMLFTVLVAVPLGLYAAYRSGSWADRAINAMTSALIAVPSFVIGLVLVLAFAIGTGWFPASNWTYLDESVPGNLSAAFLPALSLALVEIAIITPILRADAVATLENDYIALARAKGIGTARLLFRHVLRPSSISTTTLLGLALARLFGGAIVIEFVFNLPGLGSLLITAIRSNDLLLMQGLVAFIALIYVVANFAVDLLLVKLDPRVAAE
ncbi:ABC transporter permease [Actinomadura livida]|uniref:ABC transporter permease n=1 Tax=Actinomadura livida TaxID=79909 RepID=A0A7W7ICS3_9ACTN|nr:MULTISPECIES: ABC transporter permease [Actinomadura]MBB4774716.1 peptide/nickel transport system permease protein [Actinomadura catellatispora]GGU06450.1 peptide ABC transporter [Actinomadura livida]